MKYIAEGLDETWWIGEALTASTMHQVVSLRVGLGQNAAEQQGSQRRSEGAG
jgi:hypothetical protein